MREMSREFKALSSKHWKKTSISLWGGGGGGGVNRFVSIIIIKSWLTEETDHKFPNQSKRSLTVPASPGLSSS